MFQAIQGYAGVEVLLSCGHLLRRCIRFANVMTGQIGSILFMAIGVALLVGGGAVYYFRVMRRTHTTKAIILDYERRDDCYHPVYEYRVLGQVYKQVSSVGSNRKPYPIGSRVDIRYHPDQPRLSFIDSPLERWAPTIIMAFIGSIFLIIGLFGYFSGVIADTR